jgi:hypothetical protein
MLDRGVHRCQRMTDMCAWYLPITLATVELLHLINSENEDLPFAFDDGILHTKNWRSEIQLELAVRMTKYVTPDSAASLFGMVIVFLLFSFPF